MIIGLLDVVVSLTSVWAVKHAIDIASHQIEGNLYTAIGIMAGLILCNFALRISAIWVRNILGIKAQNRMQQRMLSRILRSQWQGREAIHSGDMLNRLETDVAGVVNFMAETLPDAVSVATMFIGAFCYLFWLDHTLATIIVVMCPVFLVLGKLYIAKMRQLNRDVRESDSAVQSILQESIQNRVLVKTLESEDVVVDKLEEEQHTLRRKVVRRTKFSVFSNFTVNFGFSIGYLLAFGWSAMRLSLGTLTYGGMSAFLQLVNKIQMPARSLMKLAPKFVAVFTAAERLMMFEDVPLEEQGKPIQLDGVCGVRLDDVTYAYKDDPEHPIIEHLSFDFKPGTCTAIVGETGAGKTTLLRMILALVKPRAGTLFIYNKERQIPVSPLTRCNIIYVPQGNTMLSGTIRDNLLLGNLDATDEQIEEVLRLACAEFVFELPDGVDTEVNEQGGGLSEGQAQRICIARALLRDCSLMILDEATSAIDPETEKKMLKNLLSNNARTVIFITHRAAVLEYCDNSLNIERIYSK